MEKNIITLSEIIDVTTIVWTYDNFFNGTTHIHAFQNQSSNHYIRLNM